MHLAIIRPNGKIQPGFLALLLPGDTAKCHFAPCRHRRDGFGTEFRATSTTMPVPVPPVTEQQAIVRILDAVDVAIERTRRQLSATERSSQSGDWFSIYSRKGLGANS